MPHDRHGRELKAGDTVYIPCTVETVSPNPDYCNLTVRTVEVMKPGDTKNCFSLNAGQVELCGSATLTAFFGELEHECCGGDHPGAAADPTKLKAFGARGSRVAGVVSGLLANGVGVLDIIKWLPVITALIKQLTPKVGDLIALVQQIVDAVKKAIDGGQTPETFVMPAAA